VFFSQNDAADVETGRMKLGRGVNIRFGPEDGAFRNVDTT
jgi:hypothetical protein